MCFEVDSLHYMASSSQWALCRSHPAAWVPAAPSVPWHLWDEPEALCCGGGPVGRRLWKGDCLEQIELRWRPCLEVRVLLSYIAPTVRGAQDPNPPCAQCWHWGFAVVAAAGIPVHTAGVAVTCFSFVKGNVCVVSSSWLRMLLDIIPAKCGTSLFTL